MSYLTEWWEGLSLALKIYWSIAIPFTVFFVLQFTLSFVSRDPNGSTEFSHNSFPDGVTRFRLLTLLSVLAFITIFGWTGIASTNSGLLPWCSAAVAAVSGLSMMVIVAVAGHLLNKTNIRRTMYFDNAVGETGQVFLTIPARRASQGQVQVKVGGVLRTLSAITDDENDLPNGKTIIVMRVLGANILLVTEK